MSAASLLTPLRRNAPHLPSPLADQTYLQQQKEGDATADADRRHHQHVVGDTARPVAGRSRPLPADPQTLVQLAETVHDRVAVAPQPVHGGVVIARLQHTLRDVVPQLEVAQRAQHVQVAGDALEQQIVEAGRRLLRQHHHRADVRLQRDRYGLRHCQRRAAVLLERPLAVQHRQAEVVRIRRHPPVHQVDVEQLVHAAGKLQVAPEAARVRLVVDPVGERDAVAPLVQQLEEGRPVAGVVAREQLEHGRVLEVDRFVRHEGWLVAHVAR